MNAVTMFSNYYSICRAVLVEVVSTCTLLSTSVVGPRVHYSSVGGPSVSIPPAMTQATLALSAVSAYTCYKIVELSLGQWL